MGFEDDYLKDTWSAITSKVSYHLPETPALLWRREDKAAARNCALRLLQFGHVDRCHIDAAPHQLFHSAWKRGRIDYASPNAKCVCRMRFFVVDIN